MGCEHAPNKLITGDRIAVSRQFSGIEDLLNIAIPLDHLSGSRLKVRFCQLGFHHQVSESQVDLGTVGLPVAKWDSRPEAEFWHMPRHNPQQCTLGTARDRTPVAEDIHE